MDLNQRGSIADLPEAVAIANAGTEKVYKEYPKTPEEWWNLVNEWFEPELMNIVKRYVSGSDVDKFKQAKEDKNHNMVIAVLNRAWFNAPDSMCIHTFPGWGVLCDLCSKSYLVEMTPEQLKAHLAGEPMGTISDEEAAKNKEAEKSLETKLNWEQHL